MYSRIDILKTLIRLAEDGRKNIVAEKAEIVPATLGGWVKKFAREYKDIEVGVNFEALQKLKILQKMSQLMEQIPSLLEQDAEKATAAIKYFESLSKRVPLTTDDSEKTESITSEDVRELFVLAQEHDDQQREKIMRPLPAFASTPSSDGIVRDRKRFIYHKQREPKAIINIEQDADNSLASDTRTRSTRRSG